MGMQQTVVFPGGKAPAWEAVADLLGRRGYPVQLRMVNGELSLPDQAPPPAWRELRLATPQGMVPLRHDEEGVTAVTWGNADKGLLQAWNAVSWALAEAGGGRVRTAAGELTPAEFRKAAELPEA